MYFIVCIIKWPEYYLAAPDIDKLGATVNKALNIAACWN